MIRRPPRSTQGVSSAASDVYKRQGLDYVSCSPYRVPVARLAAAQAQINGKN